jgi:hypothetical protein
MTVPDTVRSHLYQSAMKGSRISLASLVLMLGCTFATAQERPWSFITAVGGLEIGTPVQSNGRWSLPIRADVSGLQPITNRPTTTNSALVCKAVKARVEGNEIFLILETSMAGEGPSSRCPDADLGKLAIGSYTLWYGTPQAKNALLGTVRVAP